MRRQSFPQSRERPNFALHLLIFFCRFAMPVFDETQSVIFSRLVLVNIIPSFLMKSFFSEHEAFSLPHPLNSFHSRMVGLVTDCLRFSLSERIAHSQPVIIVVYDLDHSTQTRANCPSVMKIMGKSGPLISPRLLPSLAPLSTLRNGEMVSSPPKLVLFLH